jgi:hypothetical protein
LDPDCLVFDYIVLHPRWRGLKLGLLAALNLIDLLGSGCGLDRLVRRLRRETPRTSSTWGRV